MCVCMCVCDSVLVFGGWMWDLIALAPDLCLSFLLRFLCKIFDIGFHVFGCAFFQSDTTSVISYSLFRVLKSRTLDKKG